MKKNIFVTKIITQARAQDFFKKTVGLAQNESFSTIVPSFCQF